MKIEMIDGKPVLVATPGEHLQIKTSKKGSRITIKTVKPKKAGIKK